MTKTNDCAASTTRAWTAEASPQSYALVRALLLDTLLDAALVTDDNGVFVDANPAACELFGLACDDLLGKRAEDFALPEQARGAASDAEFFWHRPDGAVRCLEYRSKAGFLPGLNLIILSDNTERKRAEEWLNLMSRAIDETSTGVLITDARMPDNPITYVNPAFEAITGYPSHEALGRNCRFLQRDDRSQPERERLKAAITEGEDCRVVLRNYRRDGTLFWNELYISPIHDTSGTLTHFVGIQTDITERRRAEEERAGALEDMKRSSRQNEIILESITDAFYALDRDWRFTYINAAGERTHNRKRENVLGRNVWEEFPEAVGTIFQQQYEKAMNEQVTVTFEAFYAPLDGWFETRIYPSDNGLSIYISDVTHRRRAEQERDRFFELSSDMMCFANFEGYYTHVNPAWERTLGYSTEEMLAQPFLDLVHPEDRAATLAEMEKLAFGASTISFENRYRCRDGSYRWLQWNSAPVPTENRIYATARDVTEQKRLQAQVIQSEKLAALGEMVAGVAHEINNPLAAISGHAQLLEMHPDTQVREDAHTIRHMTERATEIALSLLSFARKGSGGGGNGHAGEHAVGDLNDTVRAALEMIRFKQGNTEIDIEMRFLHDLPPVRMNAGEIQQVVLNLVDNAEHALRERPVGQKRIVVETDRRRGEEEGRDAATISVTDNGSGIPEEILGRIFDPFFTTKDVGEGTGLGLSICHGIARSHGGTLRVHSTVGVGTTFILTLPAAQMPPPE